MHFCSHKIDTYHFNMIIYFIFLNNILLSTSVSIMFHIFNIQMYILPDVNNCLFRFYRSRFIQNIRILSTASDGESSGSDTPVKCPNKSSNSSREQRREWLRNIPNACSVYVCPDSPPIIHKTAGAPGSGSNINDINNGFGHSNDLQLLDNALGKASIREPNDLSPARKYGVNNHRHSKRRSYSSKSGF